MLIVPATAMVFLFYFRDKHEQAVNNEPTSTEVKIVRDSAQKLFPQSDIEKLQFYRLIRNTQLDIFEFQGINRTSLGELKRKGVNNNIYGLQTSTSELKYKGLTYSLEHGWGVLVKDSKGELVSKSARIWHRKNGKISTKFEEYDYHSFFWGEQAITKNGELLMFSMPRNIFSSKTLLLIRLDMDNIFYATAISIAV